jgi:glutamate dehydrogenase/leucine dehydrogenase
VHSLKETRYLVGLPKAFGGSGDTGDNTAFGVMQAMHAALMHRFKSPSLKGRRVAVQGLGKVGYHVARRAVEEGATVVAADINPHVVGRVASELGIEPTDPWAVVETPCDVLAPCALGNVVNRNTVDLLRCEIIVGSANNQLEDDTLADRLRERGILYAPDFIANAGGLIQVADEIHGYNPERVRRQIEMIYDVLLAIFQEADERGLSTTTVALEHVRRRLDTIHAIHRIRS